MARLGAEPNNLVGRGSDQQVFRRGRREADLQSGVKAGARCIQNDVHVEQLGEEKKITQASEQRVVSKNLSFQGIMWKKCL